MKIPIAIVVASLILAASHVVVNRYEYIGAIGARFPVVLDQLSGHYYVMSKLNDAEALAERGIKLHRMLPMEGE